MTIQVQQDKSNLAAVAPADLDVMHPPSGFVRHAAHDLRQPVAAILALASAAVAEAQTPERMQRRLNQIVNEANWISEIIRDMLAEADATQRAEVVDISALVRDAVASERLTCPGRIVLCQPDREPRHVQAVSAQLRRVLANVLANATRAAGKDGCVRLTQRADHDTEFVEIMDDGPGFGYIAADHGIGLQVTLRALADFGGRMEMERLPSGHTLVCLSLPIVSRGRTAGGQ
jgi:signal transduction histidine kinase